MFKIGDKVRCIDADSSFDRLVLNKEYTVIDVDNVRTGYPRVVLFEIANIWLANRFELVAHMSEPEAKASKGDKVMLKVGDKVRCINAEDHPAHQLQHNGIYTVSSYDGWSDLRLQGINASFVPNRFVAYPLPNAAGSGGSAGSISEYTPKPEVKASKNDGGKLDLSLIPYVALRAEAAAFMVGEKKYGRYNYCKGHNVSQLIAAMMRHAQAFMEGEEVDPIDGQSHLGSVRACAAMILRQQELGTLIDDRYVAPKKETK